MLLKDEHLRGNRYMALRYVHSSLPGVNTTLIAVLPETINGCQSNCDNNFEWVSPPGQMYLDLGNFTFPPGDYSATDGNPCGVCNQETTGISSPSGAYCCSQQLQCLPIEYSDCLVSYGCLYNCLEVSYIDEIACGTGGTCERATRTVKLPFSTST
jgi:hypothetical protein